MTCDVSTLNKSLIIIMHVIIKNTKAAQKILLWPSAISRLLNITKNPFCHHCCFNNYDSSEVKTEVQRETENYNENAKVIKSFTFLSQTTNEVQIIIKREKAP